MTGGEVDSGVRKRQIFGQIKVFFWTGEVDLCPKQDELWVKTF
jgi:hypothetical protein